MTLGSEVDFGVGLLDPLAQLVVGNPLPIGVELLRLALSPRNR